MRVRRRSKAGEETRQAGGVHAARDLTISNASNTRRRLWDCQSRRFCLSGVSVGRPPRSEGPVLRPGRWRWMSPGPVMLKFGGTSVGDAEAIGRLVRHVSAHTKAGAVVVVSALSGVTDRLFNLAAAAAATDEEDRARGSERPAAPPRTGRPVSRRMPTRSARCSPPEATELRNRCTPSER